MTLAGLDPSRRPPEGIETRIRRGILLVACTAVVITAVPMLVLSIANGVGLEQRKAGFHAQVIERNLQHEVAIFRGELEGLAAAPILDSALTDTAGREAYLHPFLRQRAAATRSRLRLLDYRGRVLLDTDDAAPGTAARLALAPEMAPRLAEDAMVVVAPIKFHANQRVIGGLEGRLPLAGLVESAATGVVGDYHMMVTLDGRVVYATPDAPDPAEPAGVVRYPLRLDGVEVPPLQLVLQPRLGWYAGYVQRISGAMLVAILGALLLALVATRRIASTLTAPIGRLVAASLRFRAGEVPDLGDLQEVRELADLGEALAGAFRARDAAQAAALRYTERMLEGLPVAVFAARVRGPGRFTLDYLSPGIARITGWPPEALRGAADWAALALPGSGPGFLQVPHLEEEANAEFPLRRPDGALIWLRERSRVISREGGVDEVVGTLMDISLERVLQAQAVSAGKLALLGEMATGLAHELSQPLAVMSLAAENAERSLRNRGAAAHEAVLGRLERITSQAARARGIVDHLRLFARRETPSELEPVALTRALEGALTLMGGPLRTAGIIVAVELPADLPPVRAALIPVEQILANLLINARDALGDPAPADAQIEIRAAVEGNQVVLSLRDNGPGIPPAVLERIFEPFFTTKEPGKGTGLGLSICHGTMRSFGGSIEAANPPGGGAEFRLTFQAAQPVAAAVMAVAEG